MPNLSHFKTLLCSLCLVLPACIPYNRNPELDATQEKLYRVNEQLAQSTLDFRDESMQLQANLQTAFNVTPAPALQKPLEKANQLMTLTTEMIDRIAQARVAIIEASGGYNEHGRLVGGLDHAYQEQVTIGAEQNGLGYELEVQLNQYIDSLKSIDPELPLPAIIALSQPHEATAPMDFAHYYFKDTPTIACLMALASIEWSLARCELEGMHLLSRILTAH